MPWHGFAARWKEKCQNQYNDLLQNADLVVNVCDHYQGGVFQKRNEWIVDHGNRVIAVYNGITGGTWNIIVYAQKKQIAVVIKNETGDAVQ